MTLPDEVLDFSRTTRNQRRGALCDAMAQTLSEGYDCRSCSGTCCTRRANSMMISPVEALDLYLYLREQQRLDDTLRKVLDQVIEQERLSSIPSDGSRDLLRRTYTCPFLNKSPLGCTISRTAKPYGCLAFNPNRPEQSDGGDCSTDTKAYQARESRWDSSEKEWNLAIRECLGLDWEKATIPVALRDLMACLQED